MTGLNIHKVSSHTSYHIFDYDINRKRFTDIQEADVFSILR